MTTLKALTDIAKTYGCSSLIGTQNAKTVKGEKLEYLTGILYMMPDDVICPVARLAGCRSACLVSAGRAAFTPGIGMARASRTQFFHADRKNFMELLYKEVAKVVNKAKKDGVHPAIRLNGTSDIDWSGISVNGFSNIFEAFPDTQFYDYTKTPSIIRKASTINNWHITASFSGASEKYSDMIVKASEKYKTNMAVVFDSKKLPETYLGRPVVSGDETDLRFMDDEGVVVGLYAKGSAKKDTSGFVIATDKQQ